MKLIVGLGNPGAQHAGQRHNIGFMAVDRIADAQGFGPWRGRFQGQVTEGRIGAERVTLLKPATYMNLSGQAVGEAMRYLKLTPQDVIVLHDELDLAPGQMRVKQGGGHAGHNGLRSMHQHIGEDYGRVRLGIGHPGDKARVTGHVLSDFAKGEAADWLDPLLEAIAAEAPLLAAGEAARFQTAVAARLRPARNGGPREGAPAVDGGPPGKAATGTPAAAPRKAEAKPPAAPGGEDAARARAKAAKSPLQALRERFR